MRSQISQRRDCFLELLETRLYTRYLLERANLTRQLFLARRDRVCDSGLKLVMLTDQVSALLGEFRHRAVQFRQVGPCTRELLFEAGALYIDLFLTGVVHARVYWLLAVAAHVDV